MTSKHKIVALACGLGLSLLLTACATTAAQDKGMAMDVIVQGNHSGIRFERMEIIRSAADFQNLWAAHFAPEVPTDPLPDVDFKRDMVVAVFLGQFRTGGYSAEIRSVTATGDTIVVDVVRSSPGAGCMRTQALTQPFVIAKVPRVDGAARFNVQDVATPCGGK